MDNLFSSFSTILETASTHLDEMVNAALEEELNVEPSISPQTYAFIQRYVSDKESAKKRFLSRSKSLVTMLENRKWVMSQQQQMQARSFICALPALDQVRFELCPSKMPEERFWQVLFDFIENEQMIEKEQENHPEMLDKKCTESNAVSETASSETTQQKDDGQILITSVSEDIAYVSQYVYERAIRSFNFAERLIEAVDAQADVMLSPSIFSNITNSSRGTDADRSQYSTNTAKEEYSELSKVQVFTKSEDGDSAQLEEEEEEEDKNKSDYNDEPIETEAKFSENEEFCSNASMDGYSISSLEDTDLKEWGQVRVATRKSAHNATSFPKSTEEFELV